MDEPVRVSTLHRGSTITLEGVMSELLFEETRLSILKAQLTPIIDTNNVLVVSSKVTDSENFCNYYTHSGYVNSKYKKLKFKNDEG